MPNIRQQEKRVRSAARQRLENLRYRSTVKTLTRRLEAAAESGDTATVAEEHKALVRWIDKAASRGALHKNTAARRKAQASRLATRAAAEPAAAPAAAAKNPAAAKKPAASKKR